MFCMCMYISSCFQEGFCFLSSQHGDNAKLIYSLEHCISLGTILKVFNLKGMGMCHRERQLVGDTDWHFSSSYEMSEHVENYSYLCFSEIKIIIHILLLNF